MRMAGQEQIVSLPTQFLNPGWVVHEENIPGRGVRVDGRLFGIEAGGADDGELSVSGHLLLVEQPRSARAGAALSDPVERRLAPVIVVARNAIQWRFDAGEDFQRLRQMLRVFDQVAGKADEIR